MEDLVDCVVCSHNANVPERASSDLNEQENQRTIRSLNNQEKIDTEGKPFMVKFEIKDELLLEKSENNLIKT